MRCAVTLTITSPLPTDLGHIPISAEVEFGSLLRDVGSGIFYAEARRGVACVRSPWSRAIQLPLLCMSDSVASLLALLLPDASELQNCAKVEQAVVMTRVTTHAEIETVQERLFISSSSRGREGLPLEFNAASM